MPALAMTAASSQEGPPPEFERFPETLPPFKIPRTRPAFDREDPSTVLLVSIYQIPDLQDIPFSLDTS
jgi:hypothetical protein